MHILPWSLDAVTKQTALLRNTVDQNAA